MTEFFSLFLSIAVPVTIQVFFNMSLNFIDTLMVGQLGEEAIAALGLGNQMTFLFGVLNFGISGSLGLFIGQFFGKKDFANIRKILITSMKYTLGVGILFTGAGLFFPQVFLRFFIDDPKVIQLGTQYLVIVVGTFIPLGIINALTSALRNIREPRIPLIFNAGAVLINIFLNWVLIFGHFGFPPLGVQGAALATVAARLLQMTGLLVVVWIKIPQLRPDKSAFSGISPVLQQRFLRAATGIIAKDGAWGLGMTYLMSLYGKLGVEAITAINIIMVLQRLGFIFSAGITAGAQVIVSYELGAGQKEKSFLYGRYFMSAAFITGLFMVTLAMIVKPFFLGNFNISPQVYQLTSQLFLVFVLFWPLAVTNTVFMVGIFRAGGAVRFVFFLEILSVWVVGVPAAWVSLTWLKWGIVGMFFLVMLQEVVKFIASQAFFFSRRWQVIVVEDLE